MSAPLAARAAIAIRLALNLSDQLEGYVADMDGIALAELQDAVEILHDAVTYEIGRRTS